MIYRFAAGVAGLSLAAGLLSTNTLRADTVPAITDCTATVQTPLVVKAGEQQVTVLVTETLSDSLVKADVPKESNVAVKNVAKAPDGKSVTLSIDASKAVAGSYTLVVTSGAAKCMGEVKIAAAETSKP